MDRMRWARYIGAAAIAATVLSAGSAFAAGTPVEPGTASVGDFAPAQACTCHGPLIAEWAKSMHAQALDDPIFNTKVAEADKASGGKLGAFCRKCHGPAATMTGEIAAGAVSGPGTSQGVVCSWCHQVSGLMKGEPGNTSHLVEPNGTRRAQIIGPQAPHPAAFSALHDRAEFCGGCHNVNHPVNGMHLEATYSEWLASPYADEGVTCQDCHMTEKAGQRGPSTGTAANGAPTRDNIYHMTFSGSQVALGDSEAAVARLESAAEIALDVPDVIAAGEPATATVVITNVGAGHYLPTGLTEVRQMWLEVALEKPDGSSVKLGERRFGTILKDKDGNAPAELWDATGVKSDDRIPPRGSVTATYPVEMAQGAEKATLTATLYYKSVPDELAKKAGVENPTTQMYQAAAPVFASEQAKLAEQQPVAAPDGGGPSVGLIVALGAAGVALGVAIAFVWVRSKRSAQG